MTGLVFFGLNACAKPVPEVPVAVLEDAGLIAVAPEPEDRAPLAPTLAVTGFPLVLNGPITIQFQQDLILPELVGKPVQDETKLVITPPIRGDAVWGSRRRIEYRFSKPPVFGASYAVELMQVQTSWGVETPPAVQRWALDFSVPKFELRRAELIEVDAAQDLARLVLRFNAEPKLRSLKRRLRIRAGGKRLKNVKLAVASSPANVIATVRAKQLAGLGELRVEVRTGVAAVEHGATLAKAQSFELPLVEPDELQFTTIGVKEERDGMVIELTCVDAAAEDEPCRVDGRRVLESLSVSPKVDVNVTAQKNGCRITGAFASGSYVVTIAPGLVSRSGGVLTRAYEQTVTVGRRTPRAGFVSQGRYLPRSLMTRVPVSHVNVETAKLEVRQVHEQNLVHWLTAVKETPDGRTSDQIAKIDLPLGSLDDRTETSLVDLRPALAGSKRGVFEIRLAVPGHKVVVPRPTVPEYYDEGYYDENGPNRAAMHAYRLRSAAGNRAMADHHAALQAKADLAAGRLIRVVLTDITLVAKRYGASKEALQVWVLDSRSLEPLEGAQVDLLTVSNRKVATCRSDHAGRCAFGNAKDTLSDDPPFAIVARHEDDLTYLEFADLEVPLGDQDVHGEPYSSVAPYVAAIYGDRDVYRPSETVRVVAILRNEGNVAPGAGLPALLKIWDPKKKLTAKIRGRTDEVGVVAFDYETMAFAPTGPYAAELVVGDQTIERYAFNVEEFVPERMEVTVRADEPDVNVDTEPAFRVSARYLFGPKAKDEPLELTCSVESMVYQPGGRTDYSFGRWEGERPRSIVLDAVTDVLDAEGRRTLSCPTAIDASFGTARVRALAAVFEAGSGRTTVARASVRAHPDRLYIGLATDTKELTGGEHVAVRGILVDWDGKPIARERDVHLELLRVDNDWSYEWIRDRNGARYHWRRHSHLTQVDTTVARAQKGAFEYSFKAGTGSYLLRARLETGAQTDRYFRWVHDPERPIGPLVVTDATPRPKQPAALTLKAPAHLDVGERSVVTFDAPFAGRALLTVETDQLLESRWIDVDAGAVEFDVGVKTFVPNAYASVLLIKDPHSESKDAYLPSRAFGTISIDVRPSLHVLDLSVKTPEVVLPNSTLSVRLRVTPSDVPRVATVAAVDEGILQLTRFETPNPIEDLFRRRALAVTTYETIGWTLLMPPGGRAKASGGDEEQQKGRIMPVKPVALWSGLVPIPAQESTVTVELEVPQYRGELRVMAVVTSPSRVGAASTQVTVRDPLVLQATLPRFLLDGDEFVVPVFITNLTGRAGQFVTTFEAVDGVKIQGSRARKIRLEKNGSGVLTFRGHSNRNRGSAKFVVKASGHGHESRVDAEVPFLTNRSVVRRTRSAVVEEGKNDLRSISEGFIPATETTTYTVTPYPLGSEFAHLKYLIRYPYG